MKYVFSFIKKTLNVILITEDIICIGGMWMCSILIFLGVINRYFLHFPIMWLSDLGLYIFIFYIMVSIAVTTRKQGHTGVDVFRKILFRGKPRADTIYSIFLNIVSIVVVVIFLPVTWKFMLRAMKYPEYGSLVRWFNTSWLQSALSFVVILILIHIFDLLIKNIIKLKKIDHKMGGGE